jgi:hypothetical protein
LLVNGEPVRPRMFFGGPGQATLRVEPTSPVFEFEFAAQEDAANAGTLHFRFGQAAGDVFLDNIRIVDVALGRDLAPACDFESGSDSFSRAWASWPPGPANTVGEIAVEPSGGADGTAGLHVKLREPPGGLWPDFHIYHLPTLNIVKGKHYRVTFWARADPARDITVGLYRPGKTYTHLGGPPGPFEAQIRMAAEAGVNFVSFPIEMPWPAPGEEADWKVGDALCTRILETNPKALLLPRFGAEPPDWWRKAHPEEVMQWEDGSRQAYAVVASPLYRREAAARVAALVTHLESKFGDHMAGYHPCGQNTGEWFYQDTWGSLLSGYAPADRNAWRVWLRNRYRTDTALQEAWREPGLTLDAVGVPEPARRRGSSTGILLDPATQKPLIDFAEFQQRTMADLVCDLAHAVRQASRGRKLVVFFYGYVFEFGPIRLGPATCGHYALRRVLDCPDVDMLCSPISYFDRGIGGSAPTMTAAESVALAGKMWLCEDDTRTYLGSGDFPGKFDGAKDQAETLSLLQRNVAAEATRNFATWWMDLGMTGWFNDPRLWEEMKRLDAVDRVFLEKPTVFRPEIAAVIDERSMIETSGGAWKVTEPGIYQARKALGRAGAPYGQYLLDDVIRGRVHAKLYVFLNAWQLSAAQRQALRRATRGACCVWCYAPGWHDGDKTSPEAMRELTGFRLSPVSPVRAWATPTAAGKELGLETPFGVDESIAPLFAAADASPREALATYPDGSPAIALRRRSRDTALFVGAPGLTSELIRLAAKEAGVHLHTQTDCNVYANGPIIALHAAESGKVVVDTRHRGNVSDAMTGRALGRGPLVVLPVDRGGTRILRCR